MRNNSTIFQNPEGQHLLDFTPLGSFTTENREIRIKQEFHTFIVGDALYYDVKEEKYSKALAINNIESEVCGIVSEVVNADEFIIITEGNIKTDRYKYSNGSVLYLSEVIPGFLMSANPTSVIKQVAVQTANGINVGIKMGYHLGGTPEKISMEPYTKEELDDIILNVRG